MIVVLFNSCMSYTTIFTIIPENEANEIPLGANKIVIENGNTLAKNYQISYKSILAQSYKIEKDNSEMGYILASKQDIGDTQVRLNLVCDDNSIKITTEWTAGTQTALMMGAISGMTAPNFSWYNAQWNKKSDKSTVAFANAVKVAKMISDNLKYETENISPKAMNKNDDPIYK